MRKHGLVILAAALLLVMSQLSFANGQKEAGGATVTIVMERPLWSTPDPNAPNKARIREAIKKAIGIDVQLAGQTDPADQWEKPNLMLAAGETLDIFQVPSDPSRGRWPKYKADGLIIPLNDLLSKYGADLMKRLNPSGVKEMTDKDGKIWAVADEQPGMPLYLMVRKDWLDKAGYTVPSNPTVADFEKMLQAFKTQGDEGIVPFWPESIEGWLAGAYIPTANANYVDNDGKLKPYFTNPGYKQVLAKMRDWYAKGYINKEYYTLTYQQATDVAWTRGKTGLFLTWKGLNPQQDEEQMRATVPEARLVPIMPPKGDVGPAMAFNTIGSADIMITKSSKYPDVAMKFLNWSMGTDEGWLLCQWGQENVDWVWADKPNGILKKTDAAVGTAYGHGSFASARTNFNNLKFHGSVQGKKWAAWANDPKQFPGFNPIDLGVLYDRSTFTSKDQINSMDALRNETIAKIVMGQLPLSEWDAALAKWYTIGGNNFIDDQTTQYKAQKGK